MIEALLEIQKEILVLLKRIWIDYETIIKEAIMDKLGERLETANLQPKVSKWLSGTKDRKDGRKNR